MNYNRFSLTNLSCLHGCSFSSGHTANVIGDKCYIFGGRNSKLKTNNLFLIDLFSLDCQIIQFPEEQELPEPRSLHTMTQVNKNTLVLYGGINDYSEPLAEGWVLDVENDPVWRNLGEHEVIEAIF